MDYAARVLRAEARLADARERHRQAVVVAESAAVELREAALPAPDGSLAFRNALAAERLALRDYMDAAMELRVLLTTRK